MPGFAAPVRLMHIDVFATPARCLGLSDCNCQVLVHNIVPLYSDSIILSVSMHFNCDRSDQHPLDMEHGDQLFPQRLLLAGGPSTMVQPVSFMPR